jgi:hypothetical protein
MLIFQKIETLQEEPTGTHELTCRLISSAESDQVESTQESKSPSSLHQSSSITTPGSEDGITASATEIDVWSEPVVEGVVFYHTLLMVI